jgi:single-strand DNA-binding protein
MASVNKIILIGNVGGDPEVRHLESGSVVANFNLAVNEKYKGKNGEMIEQTDWFRVEVWEGQAKVVEQYLKKGNPVYVEGRVRMENWTDREGKERASLKVRATSITLLGGRPSDNTGNNENSNDNFGNTPVAQKTVSKTPDGPTFTEGGGDDDLPF